MAGIRHLLHTAFVVGLITGLVQVSEAQVAQCSACPPGEGVVVECNLHMDTKCTPCVSRESFSTVHSVTSQCNPCTKCARGFYPLKPCTVYHDVVCDSCSTIPQLYELKLEHSKYCSVHDRTDSEEKDADDGGLPLWESDRGSDMEDNERSNLEHSEAGKSLAASENSSTGNSDATFGIIFGCLGGILIIICVVVIVYNKRRTLTRRCATSSTSRSRTKAKTRQPPHHQELRRLNHQPGHKKRAIISKHELVIPEIIITDIDGPVRPPSWMIEEEEARKREMEAKSTQGAGIAGPEDGSETLQNEETENLAQMSDDGSFTNEIDDDGDLMTEIVTHIDKCNIYEKGDIKSGDEVELLLKNSTSSGN